MDFIETGKHCSLDECKQLDFLPFTCNACGKVFCLDHRTYDSHVCPHSEAMDYRVVVCPICGRSYPSNPNDDPNTIVPTKCSISCLHP